MFCGLSHCTGNVSKLASGFRSRWKVGVVLLQPANPHSVVLGFQVEWRHRVYWSFLFLSTLISSFARFTFFFVEKKHTQVKLYRYSLYHRVGGLVFLCSTQDTKSAVPIHTASAGLTLITKTDTRNGSAHCNIFNTFGDCQYNLHAVEYPSRVNMCMGVAGWLGCSAPSEH